MAHAPKLLDQLRATLRRKHYAICTEAAYVSWTTRYIRFHQLRHPPEIAAFLTHLAVDERIAASTQNQARSALLLLYQHVLHIDLGALPDIEPAKQPQRLPVVLTRDEVRAVLAQLGVTHRLMAQLLYGGGLRLMECVRLRVKDLDFAQTQLVVRDGKGAKDRITTLPLRLVTLLQDHLRTGAHAPGDLAHGYGAVYLPNALERSSPSASRAWLWQ
jgi:integrase